ncbi:unnamed protein product [Ceratitis capitata]|uniref:(Mediterranean fruit fly) hypothetical protein n=1 Tax=Ceratitis capitata TaxID=7213 RepID=A0A811UBE8_CERCA|nr:unnamed protein product [Ceratitis capitata]
MSARMRNTLHSDFGFKLTLLPPVWLLLCVQLAVQLANAVAAKDLPGNRFFIRIGNGRKRQIVSRSTVEAMVFSPKEFLDSTLLDF